MKAQGRGVTHLDSGIAYGIDRLQGGNDFAARRKPESGNLLSVASATYFEIVSDALKGTSSDFGQLVVQRHFSSGRDCRWLVL